MPFSEMQQQFFREANHRWNFKVGATRSGKTYMDYFLIPKRIRARIGKDGLCVILGVSKATIERNILEPMRNIWPAGMVGHISSNNTCRMFGETVHCLGAEKVSQVSKLRGASIKYCYGDEVAEWNPDVFELLKSRLDKPYSCFDGALNPQGPNHWLKGFLESDVDIYDQRYTIFDNPFLPKEFVENLCKEYAGTVFYQRYILGEWALAEGLVYDMFSLQRHVSEEIPDTDGLYYVSADYGIQNATTFLLWGHQKNADRWLCVKEYYYSGRKRQKQKTVSELVQGLKDMLGDIWPYRVIIDPSAAALDVELRRNGFSTLGADNDVLNGIADVCSMLHNDQLLISANCKNTIAEFQSYSWDDKAADHGEDKPIKENDHCMDAVRYFVRTRRLVKHMG